MSSKFFTVKQIEGVTELKLGSADFVAREIITLAFDDLNDYVKTNKPKRIVLNFGDVKHVSSEFLTAMIRLRDQVGGNDGELRMSHMCESVLLPFKITKLAGKLFHVHETTAQAIDAF